MADLIDLDAARARVVAAVPGPLAPESVPALRAPGRWLAEDVVAADDVPGFDNSAMDGFAVRAADTTGAPVTLPLAGESRAGHPAAGPLPAGAAMAISTGAMLPQRADAVVRIEDTASADGSVEVRVAVEPGRDVRRAGEDVRAGSTVLRAGTRLGPAELGVLASVGVAEAPCARRPRVAVLTTGDELVGPGEPRGPGGVRDTNAVSVAALAHQAGAEVVDVARVPDDATATVAALRDGLRADVLVACGGVSVGAHDHVKPALAELGVEPAFWGVALRPGKPTWFGIRGETLAFGLPGNPVSAMVTFHLFVRPALLALAGATEPETRVEAVMDEAYAKSPGRAHAVRCRLEARADGWHVRPTGPQDSHILTSMLGAQALALLPADRGDVAAGERVEIELLPSPTT
jgi:molybdopterin molybdotransferase